MADPTIDTLDPQKVADAEAYLTTFLKEQYPSMDLSEGRVLRNLLIRPAAIFHVLNQENIDLLRQSMSLEAIEANPDLADPAYVDAVLSNFLVTRNPGSNAVGQATIILQALVSTVVPAETVFAAGGLQFGLDTTYVGVTTQEAVLSAQQRLIVPRNDGTFAFTVPLTASSPGSIYNIKRNTRMTVTPAIIGLIDCLATSDFSGGVDEETNQQLIDRFKLGISPKVFSGRVQIEALLKDVVDYKQISIIGYGDAEMLRDRHNIFVVSQGGKSDFYVRTQDVPVEKTFVKTATLIDPVNKIWQLAIERDDAPGFYTVESVLPVDVSQDEGTLEITEEVRGLDLTPFTNEFVPEIQGLTEGGFSRYQTAVVKFIDPDTPAPPASSSSSSSNQPALVREYQVRVLYMPGIDLLQAKSSDREARAPQADYLVRAPVPIFCTVSLKVLYRDGLAEPDVGAIQQEVARVINGIGFTLGRLPASLVYDAVHTVVGSSGVMVVSPLDLRSRLIRPDGSHLDSHSVNELVVPATPELCVTSRTAVFYLNQRAVDVAVEKVPVLPV